MRCACIWSLEGLGEDYKGGGAWEGGGATTIGLDATQPPAICQNSIAFG